MQSTLESTQYFRDVFYRHESLVNATTSFSTPQGCALLLTQHIQLFIEKSVLSFSSEIVFEKKALDLLMSHDWPGNVRQLIDTVKKFEIHNLYHVMEEDVVKILGVKKENKNEFLSKKQKEFIYKNGFNEFMRLLEMEIMKDAVKKFSSKTTATQMLGIGNRKGSRIYQEAFRAGVF